MLVLKMEEKQSLNAATKRKRDDNVITISSDSEDAVAQPIPEAPRVERRSVDATNHLVQALQNVNRSLRRIFSNSVV